MKQPGAGPVGMRGGGRPDMGEGLSHIGLDQMTDWD
mgnify:CR=1 FL=1